MGVPDARVFWLALAALTAATLATPDHFDQRQTGQYNVRIQLKELKIVAVSMPDSDDEGDYDEGNYDYEDPIDPLEHHTKSTTPKTTTLTATTPTTGIANTEPNDDPVDPVNTKSTTPETSASSMFTTRASSSSPNKDPIDDTLDPVNTKSSTPKTPIKTKTTSTTPANKPSAFPLSTESTFKPVDISGTADSPTTPPRNISKLPSTDDKPTSPSLNASLVAAFWNDITSFNDVVTTVEAEETKSTADFNTELVTDSEASTPAAASSTEQTTTKRVNNKYDPTKRIRARVRCRPGYSKDRSGLCRKTRVTVKPVAALVSQL